MARARAFEDHFDFRDAASRCGLSVSMLRRLVKDGDIDPVVEIPGKAKDCSKILIPASSLAKYLARYRVTRNPEGIAA